METSRQSDEPSIVTSVLPGSPCKGDASSVLILELWCSHWAGRATTRPDFGFIGLGEEDPSFVAAALGRQEVVKSNPPINFRGRHKGGGATCVQVSMLRFRYHI